MGSTSDGEHFWVQNKDATHTLNKVQIQLITKNPLKLIGVQIPWYLVRSKNNYILFLSLTDLEADVAAVLHSRPDLVAKAPQHTKAHDGTDAVRDILMMKDTVHQFLCLFRHTNRSQDEHNSWKYQKSQELQPETNKKQVQIN